MTFGIPTPLLLEIIDIIGIVIGIASVIQIQISARGLGGRVASALNLFTAGIIAMVLAFTWTLVFVRLKLYAAPALDAHHLLMMLGMILFVLAARRFSTLMQG